MVAQNGNGDAPAMIFMPEVVKLIGRSRQTVAQMVRRGDLPRPVIGGRNKAWPRAALLAYLGLGK